jgi:hypothetical protein
VAWSKIELLVPPFVEVFAPGALSILGLIVSIILLFIIVCLGGESDLVLL